MCVAEVAKAVGLMPSGGSAPVIQQVAAPAATQASKTPDTPALMAAKRKSAGGMGGGTLLTGMSGAATGADQLGKTTLLGQ